jgi:hypothetical protein
MKANDRIELQPFGMIGTVVEIQNIKRYAKNYCDGFSNIRLSDKVVAVVVWDESPNVKCTIDQDGFNEFTVIN